MSKNIQYYEVSKELVVELNQACDMSLVCMDEMPVGGDFYVAEVLDGKATMLETANGNSFDYDDVVEYCNIFGVDGATYVILEVGYSLAGDICELQGISRDDLNGFLCRIWGLDTDDPDVMDALEQYISRAYRVDYDTMTLHLVSSLINARGDWTAKHVQMFEDTVGKYVRV